MGASEKIVICVVGRRCVYINNYRAAGGKPYVSEQLPEHSFNTTVDEVLSAFSTKQIRDFLTRKGGAA